MTIILAITTLIGLDPPRPTIGPFAIDVFLEERAATDDSKAKKLFVTSGQFDDDFHRDIALVYTLEKQDQPSEKPDGLYVVAFLTEGFLTSNILYIPRSEIIPESVRGWSSAGYGKFSIEGSRYMTGDDPCCPSALVSLTIRIKDREPVLIEGSFTRNPETSEASIE